MTTPRIEEEHTKDNCPCPYSLESVRVGRAHNICPVCKRDVTLEEVFLYQALQDNEYDV